MLLKSVTIYWPSALGCFKFALTLSQTYKIVYLYKITHKITYKIHLGENFEALYLTDRVEKKLEWQTLENDHVETTPYKLTLINPFLLGGMKML